MLDQEDSKTASCLAATAADTSHPAAVLLEENGVEPAVSRALANEYPYERIVDVVATMQFRRSRGKCDNPGGFIRDALVKQWQTPKAVTDARARAQARIKSEARLREHREIEGQRAAAVDQEQSRIDRLVDSMDDDELGILAEAVLAKYRDNPAVTRVLTRTLPRNCRLMRMEIAAQLGGSMSSGV
jgi:hypothetical protein